MSHKYMMPMLERTFEILEYMYSNVDNVSLNTITKELEIPKTTAFRIMTTMEKWGYIEKVKDQESYRLGKTLIKVGQRAASNIDITDIGMPYLDELSKEVGESANLGILYEDNILTLANSKGEDFYLISKLIPLSPLNCSSMGKQYLADFPDEKLREYFQSSKPQKRTVNSIMTFDSFLPIKDKIKDEGISYDREEYEYGLTCFAAPIRDNKGSIVAAISISGPTTRLQYKGEKMLKDAIKEKSHKISQEYMDVFQ